jgi:hypothetical protein
MLGENKMSNELKLYNGGILPPDEEAKHPVSVSFIDDVDYVLVNGKSMPTELCYTLHCLFEEWEEFLNG